MASARAAKIAISLPRQLVERIAMECQQRGETRSAFIRRAVEQVLGGEREREAVACYLRGYAEEPEGEQEKLEATALAGVLREDPW